MGSNPKPKWLVVDVSSWAHPDLHAAGPGAASLSNFTRRLTLCCDQLRPERVALCFDSGKCFRHQIDATYKANRKESPVGLAELIAGIRKHARDHEIDIVDCEGFEADDCMATLVSIALDQGQRVILASRDKDLRQLLLGGAVNMLLNVSHGTPTPKVEYSSQVPTFEYYTAADLQEQEGLRPDQWVEYQMLVGDSTDNVPGCIDIGGVNAKEILRACSTLDRFKIHSFDANISDSRRTKVLNFLRSGEADKMRKLVTLRHDVPLPAYWFAEAVA